MPEAIKIYLTQIGAQIRWNRARPVLLRELEDHALAQLSDYLADGLSQEDAEAETIRQLGDPVEIGQQLDRLHRPRPQWGLLILTVLLVLTGTALQYFLLRPVNPVRLPKLLVFSAAGLAALLLGYFSNRHALVSCSPWICCTALGLGVWLALFSDPRYAHYLTMWYSVVFVLILCRLQGRGWMGNWLSILTACALLLVTLLNRRLLDLMVLTVTVSVLLLAAARTEWFSIGCKQFLPTIGLLLVLGFGLFLLGYSQNIADRLFLLLHPEAEPLGRGYMALTIRSALAGARLWGAGSMTGRWEGTDFWRTVPEGAADAFLVAVIHTIGWIPFVLLPGLLVLLFAWILIKVIRRTSASSRFLAASILTIFSVHLIAGILLTFGWTGVSAFCPFLKMSAETIVELGLMGLLLSLFRQEALPDDRNFSFRRPSLLTF